MKLDKVKELIDKYDLKTQRRTDAYCYKRDRMMAFIEKELGLGVTEIGRMIDRNHRLFTHRYGENW